MTHAEIIQKNYDVLLRCTAINYYVIDFLKGENVLDRMQEAELKETKNSVKQRILLFQWLQELPSEKYKSFLQVMKDTEQEHVANLLRERTEEGHLPLLNTRHDRLEKIRHKIAHVICADSELVAELRMSTAISRIDADEIRAEKGEYVKSSKLISAIMRRSNQCYDRFQDALRKTLQTAAAEFLYEGEMPAIHLNNNRPDLDENLSLTFNEAIRNNSGNDTRVKELITEMNGYGLTPVKAIPGQSIVIFIYCKTVQNAVKFMQLFSSGTLQYLLDSIFCRLLSMIEPRNTKELDSLISLEDEEIATLEEFTGIEGWKTQRLGRLKNFGKKSERDATTQTDDNVTKTEITDWMPVELEEETAESTLICNAETQTEHQSEENDSKICEQISAEIEIITSWSSAESSAGAEIADVDADVYAAASRKLYWKQERRTFYKNFESLLNEEEELLNFFVPDMATSDDSDKGWDWEQRRTVLSQKLETLVGVQNYILKLLIPSETSSTGGLRQAVQNIDDKLKQQQQSWKNLKEQVLSGLGEFKPSTSKPISSTSINKIGVRLHEVRYLKYALKKDGELSGRGDLFSALESLMVEVSKEKQQTINVRKADKNLTFSKRSDLPLQLSSDSEDEFLDDYYLSKHLSIKQREMGSTDRRGENIDLEWSFERTKKENRMLVKQLNETATARLETLNDFIALKAKLEVALNTEESETLKKLLEHQTPTVELPVKFRSDPILVQTIKTKAAEDTNNMIKGLTILDNELFVVTGESPEVEVYDSRKLSFSRRHNLSELISPEEIGSCNRNKCLYIIDSKCVGQSNEILRVDPNGMLIKIWLTGDNCEWGLSVTDESNVILALQARHKLREYSPDGQLICEINLSTEAGIRSPWHVIKLTNGHFLVSHGYGCDDQQKLSIVDSRGKLQKSFGGTPGSTIVQMKSPRYLSVDSSGFVMVADHDNSRVLLLDQDLEFRKELLCKEKHGLRFPQRILLDESNDRLLVVDFDGRGGQILVFRLGN